MFVNAPTLTSNGVLIDYQTLHKGNGGGNFNSIGAAAAGPFGDAPLVNTAFKGYTIRNYGTSGKVDGNLVPTRYFTRRVNVEMKRGLKWVVQIPPSGGNPAFYVNRYREIGVGYLGGDETGIGYPESLWYRDDTTPRLSAIANRAIGSNLEQRCLAEALNKCRDQKFDMGESLVGLGQTYWMVLERTAQLILAYRQARRGEWKGVLKTLGITDPKHARNLPTRAKDGANLWLELQFGWLPLMSDIHDGINLFNSGLSKPKSTVNVVRRISDPLPFFEWTGTNEAFGWQKTEVTSVAAASVEVRHRFRISDPYVAYLKSLGLDNPAYVAWVAIPWSFVVDWCLPVGDWLQSVSAPLGLTYINGYMSSRRSGVADIHGLEFGNMHDPTFPTVWRSAKSAWTRVSAVELNRFVYTDWPRANPYFKFPFTSAARAANMAALLLSTRRGDFRHS